MIEDGQLLGGGIHVPEVRMSRQSPLFALYGTIAKTSFDRGVTAAIPFIGLETPRTAFSEVGVGVYFPENGKHLLSGSNIDEGMRVVRNWRNLKVLEKVLDEVGYMNRSVFTMAVWSAAPLSRPDTVYFPEMLGDQMRDRGGFVAFRDGLLNSGPTTKELDTMLTVLREQKVLVSIGELGQEALAGRIQPGNWIEVLTEDERVRRQERELLTEQRRQELAQQVAVTEATSPETQPKGSGYFWWLGR